MYRYHNTIRFTHVDADSRDLQGVVLEPLVKVVDTGRGLLRNTLDVCNKFSRHSQELGVKSEMVHP
jgi:hypothetical protein